MRRWMGVLAVLAGLTVAVVGTLIWLNPAPAVPAIPAAEIAATTPYVVKLHAQWCPICMLTKDEWAEVQGAYASKVRFVVFDFTNAATTEATRLEAARLGLTTVFDDYSGVTGTVLILDGVTREVKHDLHGHRDHTEYRAAIDQTPVGQAR